MNISEFTIQRFILEARFDPAYLHWDRAGSIWHQLGAEWKGLERAKSEPNATTFHWKNMYEFGVELERAFGVAFFPGSALEHEVFGNFDLFIETICRELAVNEFKRIGLRVVFRKQFETEQDASDRLLSLGLINVPNGKQFGVTGDIRDPAFDVRWEGEELGVKVRISTAKEKIDFDPPAGVDELSPLHKERSFIVYDVDYFTTAVTEVGQFKPLQWMPPVIRVIRRDAEKFLGG